MPLTLDTELATCDKKYTMSKVQRNKKHYHTGEVTKALNFIKGNHRLQTLEAAVKGFLGCLLILGSVISFKNL